MSLTLLPLNRRAASCTILLWGAALLLGTCSLQGDEPYKSSWESLRRHQIPEWFRDAKFGIYTHWGPVTVGSENAEKGRVQWYGKGMYEKKNAAFEFHRQHFGDQKEFGYKDVIDLFQPDQFDPDEWAELFAAAGARFAGPVAIHHDNFALWDSDLTIWDSVDKGPHRDITGELEKAIRRRGMKFIATFHHSFSWRYFEPSYEYDGRSPGAERLYWPHKVGDPPSKVYLEEWLGKVNEVVHKYEPDMIWFDFGLGRVIPPEYQQRMFADYYNWAAAQNRPVCVAHKHREIHEHTGVLDFERGREDRLTPYPWLTDTSVGPWFHQKSVPFKTVNQLVDVLVDIVSKNGCMLLNVGPESSGAIPPKGRELLLGIGRWLKVNGPAIYDTRPWLTHGEGPTTQEKSGGFSERHDREFTAHDIRFTQSKDGKTLYVILLDWPSESVTVKSMKVRRLGEIELLGSSAAVTCEVNEKDQLVIDIPNLSPAQRPAEHAVALRLSGFDVELQ